MTINDNVFFSILLRSRSESKMTPKIAAIRFPFLKNRRTTKSLTSFFLQLLWEGRVIRQLSLSNIWQNFGSHSQ